MCDDCYFVNFEFDFDPIGWFGLWWTIVVGGGNTYTYIYEYMVYLVIIAIQNSLQISRRL